jgi:hypothetical protein
VAACGAAAVQRPALAAPVVAHVASTLAGLHAAYPGPMGALLGALPEEQRAALQAAMPAGGG